MFKVELKINGDHIQTVEFAEPVMTKDIVTNDVIKEKKIIAYKLDGNYINSDTIMSEDCRLDCVSLFATEGYAIYQDTAIMVLCKAFFNVISKEKKLVIEHSIGDGVFCEVMGYTFTQEDVEKLVREMQNIIDRAIPIEKIHLNPEEADKLAQERHRDDFIKIMKYQNIDMYKCGDYYDYYLRQLAENTSQVIAFKIHYHSPGIILRVARKGDLEIKRKFVLPRKLFATHQEHDKWLNILNLHTTSALNRAVKEYHVKDLIQIEEALHEKKVIGIADHISWQNAIKLILIAGPSSSGKTTFAKRLSVQLRVNNVTPLVLSMDNYFLPRSQTPRKANGEFDFESIHALDLELLNHDLSELLQGKEINLPKYNFLAGKREISHQQIRLAENNVIILEGIHGLNDSISSSIPFNQKVRIYVSALNNLNIDAHNRIATTDSRKIRRLVRDNKYRGHTAEQTLGMWDSIREGEDRNIFPYQENADFMFNSILTYELAVLKKYVKPLLQSITQDSRQYNEAKRLLKIFDHIYNVDDNYVPSNSILREFIGGSIFDY
ncbi:MAG TPA: nucleoside kinase [Candidatus Cloacimonadota bacterium]|nr:nucleoside kinase [Candidatus Cloacimonadota bacterium]